MKRLHHPSIIQFVDVFEDADHLMMIMEFCPGQELFDVILNRKFFQEDDARPIFAQIARALFYLHSLNIIHRDVKPENILISNIPDPKTGGLVAKLLDFGLSKNAGNGSAAKTFVGTPCYVAPEVEYTSKGLGGTYSFPADCWSLGAVLYVMLVARFPEFEQDLTGKVVVKLNPALWGNVSNEAKDLIRSLMNTNPAARLTMAGTLQHPWLGRYRATQEEISRTAVASYDLSQSLQEEEARLEALERERARQARKHNAKQTLNGIGEIPDEEAEDLEISASGVPVHHQAMVVRLPNGVEPGNATGEQQLHLAPLLHLQRSIAECFEEVHASYKDLPEVASEIRQGATLCRDQLTESTKMLRKVEQTAAAVLGMFPDLELAVEEGEPQLAADFFAMVKGWVAELREMVNSTQGINKASMFQVRSLCLRFLHNFAAF
jgi:serine/threonine protein kinase